MSEGNGKPDRVATPAGRNILVVSRVGCVGDLCRQLLGEGHAVRYFIESKGDKDVSDIDNQITYQNHFSNRQSGTHILFYFQNRKR